MITVYSPIKSNRFFYAIKLVLAQVCELEYRIIHNKEEINETDKVINYSGNRIAGSFQIHPHGLLSEKFYNKFDVNFDYGGEEKLKIFLTEFDHLGFDIFSASFFLASRMEEYWKHDIDEHERYTSVNSLMHKLGVLHIPLINVWGKSLLNRLNNHFKVNFTQKRVFKIINTIDVDNAWAFKNKGLLRSVGGIGKSILKGEVKESKNRVSTIAFGQNDPYDTYDYIDKISKENKVESLYFFLLGDRGEFDKNVSYKNTELNNLILNKSQTNSVGIHPSYQSFKNKEQQLKELKRLENITQKPIVKARKHFLRLSIPETYRLYEKIGVKEDYSMGYADHIGFRAGICTPYTFFDLLEDRDLDLQIIPFAYMDGTLNQYMKLSIDEALIKVDLLKSEVKNVDGLFIGVWHNETLNDIGIWKGWKAVFEAGLKDLNS